MIVRAILLGSVLAVLTAPAAQAGTLTGIYTEGYKGSYTVSAGFVAGPGERNDITLTGFGRITDAGAPITIAPTDDVCRSIDQHTAECDTDFFDVDTGDMDDAVRTPGPWEGGLFLNAGSGDDLVDLRAPNPARDLRDTWVTGGPGDDTIFGTDGFDDEFSLSPGKDTVDLVGSGSTSNALDTIRNQGPKDTGWVIDTATHTISRGDDVTTYAGTPAIELFPPDPTGHEPASPCPGGVSRLPHAAARKDPLSSACVWWTPPGWRGGWLASRPVVHHADVAFKVRCEHHARCRGRLAVAGLGAATTFTVHKNRVATVRVPRRGRRPELRNGRLSVSYRPAGRIRGRAVTWAPRPAVRQPW